MRRKALWIAAAVAGISMAGGLAYRARRAERATALGQQAERLLHPPFEQAPAFADIRATEARTLVDEAKELAALPEFRFLEAEAAALERLQQADAAGARKALGAVPEPQPASLKVLLAAVQLSEGQLDAADQTLGQVLEGASAGARGASVGAGVRGETAPRPAASAVAEREARAAAAAADEGREVRETDLRAASNPEASNANPERGAENAAEHAIADAERGPEKTAAHAISDVTRGAEQAAERRPEKADAHAISDAERGPEKTAAPAISDVTRGAEQAAERGPEKTAAPAISDGSRGATIATHLRALMLASDVARAKGQGDRALAFAERGLAMQASAALYERRGLARELLGELRAAREDFEHAAQLDSKLTSPLLHLGRVLRELGEMRAAVLAFSGAAHRNPKESEAWLGAGLCRIGLGDMSGARADLERAEELAPAKAAPLIALGDVDAAERHWDEAERHYSIATKLEPDMSLPWLKLGNTRMRKSQPAAAAEAYRKAIDRQAELAAAHNGLGAALQAQGDAEGARRELEQAAKLDPTDPNPLLNLARLYRQQGNDSAAETALAQAQARAPTTR